MVAEQRLTHDDVRDIAELAKLALADDEVETYTQQLSQILDYFKMLQAVDTSQVQSTESVLPHRNVLREDTPQAAIKPQEAVANAPDSEDHQFKVSAVLGGE